MASTSIFLRIIAASEAAALPNRKLASRVPTGVSTISITGNRKRFRESFKRWQRTEAFHAVSETAGVVDALRRSRDAGYF